MSKHKRPRTMFPGPARVMTYPALNVVDSLYDAIQEGNEYGSIVSVVPKPEKDLIDEIQKGIRAIEEIRSRPCLAYVGNVVRSDDANSGIVTADDLPFAEMLQRVPADQENVDVFLATMGGVSPPSEPIREFPAPTVQRSRLPDSFILHERRHAVRPFRRPHLDESHSLLRAYRSSGPNQGWPLRSSPGSASADKSTSARGPRRLRER